MPKIYQPSAHRLETKDLPRESPIPEGWFASKAEALGNKPAAPAPAEAVKDDPPGGFDDSGNGKEIIEWNATAGAVKLADARAFDISTVTGTGKGGRITVGDVEKAL